MSNIRKLLMLFSALAVLIISFPSHTFAEEASGITGVVKTPWVRRYPAVVYIEKVAGEFQPPKEKPFMSQKSLVFEPHILPVVKGTTIDFTNDDNVVHNVFAPPGSAKAFNLGTYGVGVSKTITFNDLGEVTLLCNVHPEMNAYILILQNPYFTVTDKKGNFIIEDVPPGKYTLKVWHEKLKDTGKEVTVEQGKQTTIVFEKKVFKKR